MTATAHRRIARRLTHRSRSASAAVVAVVVALAGLYAATEIALERLGRPALLVAPSDALASATRGDAWVLPAAGGAALAALVLLILAFAPGRRARHVLADDRMTVVADDVVLAGSLRRSAATAAGLKRERVRASVGRRVADLHLTPTSGLPVDRESVDARAAELLAALRPHPAVRARVAVAESGVVGA